MEYRSPKNSYNFWKTNSDKFLENWFYFFQQESCQQSILVTVPSQNQLIILLGNHTCDCFYFYNFHAEGFIFPLQKTTTTLNQVKLQHASVKHFWSIMSSLWHFDNINLIILFLEERQKQGSITMVRNIYGCLSKKRRLSSINGSM